MIKKIFFLFFFSMMVFTGYSIKFKVKTKKGKEINLQAIFDIGFSAQGISDDLGITDYQTGFIRPAFVLNDFGIGLDFTLRFRLFAGQPPYNTKYGATFFKTTDWYVENDPLQTFYLYMDKIDFIYYGSFDLPIYLKTGEIPTTTFGTGFLINNFHNISFLPTSRENGFYFHFNGEHLDKFKMNNLPLSLTFFIPDLLDPDIFAFDINGDLFKKTPLPENFSLKLGFSTVIDFNATESNRLSALPDNTNDIVSNRNLYTNNIVQYTTAPLFTSIYIDFSWRHKYFKLSIYEEFTMLFDIPISTSKQFNFGFGNNLGVEMRLVKLKNSGFLLGLSTGFMFDSPYYLANYFSSNYEVVRKYQYSELGHKDISSFDNYTFYITAGIGFYGFHDKLQFVFNAYFPIDDEYYQDNVSGTSGYVAGNTQNKKFGVRFSSKFVLKDVVPGLSIGLYYETLPNTMFVTDNGGTFLESITRHFRFSSQITYKFYGAKISAIIGVQTPGWVVPQYTDAATNPVPQTLDSDKYSNDLEKFISLEVSFVF